MGWTEWRAADAAMRALEAARRRARLDLECIETDQDLAYCEILNGNPRWRRTVNAFLDMRVYRKTAGMSEWRKACGTDGRLWKTTRRLGWPRLWRILLLSRKMR